MKILIDESVLRQTLWALQCSNHVSAIESIITALRSALDAAEKVEEQLTAVTKERDELAAVLKAVQHVANESTGIIGWHLNGDIAAWDELLPEVDAAIAKLGADKGEV